MSKPESREDAARLIGPAITDVAGEPAGRVQVERLVERYHWAGSYCAGKTILEVACGTGQGLGLLRSRAARAYGCDLSSENLRRARATYGDAVPLVQADAQTLPFADESLDVIILLETLYFLPSAETFLSESARVLKPGGRLLISCINKDCPDFNPNHPLYYERYGAPQLSRAISNAGFEPECFGIIPMDQPSLRSRIFGPVKKFAVKLNLIPDSMQARLLLKRIVFGKLDVMPADISFNPAPARAPAPIACNVSDNVHQVVLCAGTRLART
jgi:SAM-dependent methyltransferase